MSATLDAIRADHRALQRSRSLYDDRYRDVDDTTDRSLLRDLIGNIGLQQLAVFRVACALDRRRAALLAMIVCRFIRHVYAAEMHWNATLAPGVVIVHGNGLVISRSAIVETGCVLSQNVTLGISSGPNRTSGAPHLMEGVHVGPGAVLVGPIVVGPASKIAPGAVVTESIPAGSIVRTGPSLISQRAPGSTT